jgi:ribosomal protein S18 acetylase RimI-like enzyme
LANLSKRQAASGARHKGPPCTLKPAAAADLPPLDQLDQAIFPNSAYSAESWVAELKAAMVFIALSGDTAVGFISVARTGDDIEIRKIGVLPGYRRAGIAQYLLQHAAQAFAGAERILIDVAADNLAGIAFYRKSGFTEIARRRKYYADGSDAVVMAAQGEALHKIMSAPSAK